jgi:hypothetical protein
MTDKTDKKMEPKPRSKVAPEQQGRTPSLAALQRLLAPGYKLPIIIIEPTWH